MTSSIILIIILFNEGLISIQLIANFRRVRVQCIAEHGMVVLFTIGALIAQNSATQTPANWTLAFVATALAIAGFVRATVLTNLLMALYSRAMDGYRFQRASKILDLLLRLPTPFDIASQKLAVEELAQLRHGDAEALLTAERDRLSQALATRNMQHATMAATSLVHSLVMARRWHEVRDVHMRVLGGQFEGLYTVTVAMLARTYAVLGALDRVEEALQTLERQQDRAADLGSLNVARLVYLAYSGAHEEVDFLLGRGSGLIAHAPSYVRPFYRAIAAHRAGQRDRAMVLFEETVAAAHDEDRHVASESVATFLSNYDRVPPLPRTEAGALLAESIAERLRPYAAVPGSTLGFSEIPVTWTLTLLNLLVWLALAITGDTMRSSDLVAVGALYAPAVAAGEWWRLLTAVFLHAGFVHVLVNSIGLLYLGRLTERLYGSSAFFVLYLLSGLAGTVASLTYGVGISVGASGAIYGILGALIALLLKGKARFPEAWRSRYLNWMVMLAAINLFFGSQIAQIDNAAHMGGLAGGFVGGLVLARHRYGDRRARALEELLRVGVIAGALVIAVAGYFAATTSLDETRARLTPQDLARGRVEFKGLPGAWIVTHSHRSTMIMDPTRDAYMDLLDQETTDVYDVQSVAEPMLPVWTRKAIREIAIDDLLSSPMMIPVSARNVVAAYRAVIGTREDPRELYLVFVASDSEPIVVLLKIVMPLVSAEEQEVGMRAEDAAILLETLLESAAVR